MQLNSSFVLSSDRSSNLRFMDWISVEHILQLISLRGLMHNRLALVTPNPLAIGNAPDPCKELLLRFILGTNQPRSLSPLAISPTQKVYLRSLGGVFFNSGKPILKAHFSVSSRLMRASKSMVSIDLLLASIMDAIFSPSFGVMSPVATA